jgi:hypothetical protein
MLQKLLSAITNTTACIRLAVMLHRVYLTELTDSTSYGVSCELDGTD